MTNEEYWRYRSNKRYLHYTNQVSKIEKELVKLYKDYKKELLDNLKIATLTVQAHNTKSNQYKLNKIQDEIKKVDTIINSLNKSVDKILCTYLVDNYVADKANFIDALQKQFPNIDITFKTPNVKLVEELVRSNYWSGLTFSERLYSNNEVLKKQLKEIMQAGVIRGQGYNKMATQLSDRLNISYNNAYRLVKTEMKAAITRADLDTYEKCGIEYCKTITSGKDNVCPECKKRANKKIKIKDAKPGVNVSPYHPRCTCSIIPVVSLKLQQTSDTIEVD